MVVQAEKDVVKDAPNIDDDGHIDPSEEDELYRYYGDRLGGGYTFEDSGRTGTGDYGTTGDHSTTSDSGTGNSGTGDSGSAMIRSEEQVRVGTERVETGRARLRKYVVTENVTKTVPVSREEVRLEREPVTDGDSVPGGTDIGEEEQVVTLHAEEPVVEKEAVPWSGSSSAPSRSR